MKTNKTSKYRKKPLTVDTWLQAMTDGRFAKTLREGKFDPANSRDLIDLTKIIMAPVIVDAINNPPRAKKNSSIDQAIDRAVKEERDPFLAGIDYTTEERKKKRHE